MKKTICILLVCIGILTLCSCGAGVSVPFTMLQNQNSFDRLFSEHAEITAYEEILDYGTFSYTLYCEKAENENLYGYNFKEIISSDYTFFAYEGSLFIRNNGKLYTILQLDGLYSDFIEDYKTTAHPLESGSHYQVNSYKSGTDRIVTYRSEITPQMEADLYEYGAEKGEYIFSVYTVSENGLIDTVVYSIGKEADDSRVVLKRTFHYFTDKNESAFADVSDLKNTVPVHICYQSREDTFSVPENCYLGFDAEKIAVSLYTDKDCTVLLDADNTIITAETYLYAK